MKLGYAVSNLRRRKASLSQNQLDALEALGFDWGVSLEDNWRRNLLALTTFSEVYGHMRVLQHFVVPTDDPMWPDATSGMNLGSVVNSLRRRKEMLPQYQIDALNFFGFEWTAVST